MPYAQVAACATSETRELPRLAPGARVSQEVTIKDPTRCEDRRVRGMGQVA